MTTNDKDKNKRDSVEQKLSELEKILLQLETGNGNALGLEKAINTFERGVTLSNELKEMLANYERRVKILMNDEKNSHSLQDFHEK